MTERTDERQDAVERVLARLRDVETPVGLEERVLRGVEARVSAESGVRRGWFGIAAMRRRREGLVWGVSAGTVLAGVCVALLWTRGEMAHRPMVVEQEVSRHAVVAVPVAAVPVVAASAAVAPAVVRVEASAPVAARRAVVRAWTADVTTDRGSDAIALEEMRAPSQPAPPLPLTQQERLLLRVVEKGAPEEIAMLDPVQRERAEVMGKAEVQRFFDPPKPKGEGQE